MKQTTIRNVDDINQQPDGTVNEMLATYVKDQLADVFSLVEAHDGVVTDIVMDKEMWRRVSNALSSRSLNLELEIRIGDIDLWKASLWDSNIWVVPEDLNDEVFFFHKNDEELIWKFPVVHVNMINI